MKDIYKLIALFLLVSFFVSACGRKGVPVPPGTLRPQKIKDLSYKIIDEGAIISWSIPFKNHDGSPIDKIKEFRLYRAEVPFDGFCKECPPPYGSPIIIKYNKKPEPGKKIVYEDTTVQEGYYYIYQVKTVKNLLNVSDFSNKIIYAWHVPPKRPLGLEANVKEDGIELTWISPESFVDGRPIDAPLEYRIFRRFDNEKDFEKIVDSTGYTNFFDKIRRVYRKVEYAVSALYTYHGTQIESNRSIPLVVKARGRQEISSPRLIKILKSKDGIIIKWAPVKRPGIMGYFVYRKDPTNIIVQLNTTPFLDTSFIDKSILMPGRYTYWVTAIDDSIPPNESAPSNQLVVIIKK